MKGLIYKATCEVTGGSYIGKTRSAVKQRWYQHCSDAKRGCDRELHQAIREHGSDAFDVVALQEWDDISNLDLQAAETHWIREKNTFHGGDNMIVAGESTLPPVPAEVQRERSLALKSETKELIAASLSDNTLRAYHQCLDSLMVWLGGRTLDDVVLAEYLTHLFELGKSPSTVAQVVAAVRWRAKYSASQPSLTLTITESVLRGIRRKGRERGRGQVDGLTWKDVERVCIFAETDGTVAGLRDSAMIRLMSDCLLRVSEVVSVNCGDLKSATLDIRSSKTDQDGVGVSLYVCEATRDVLSRYRERGNITRGAVFRHVRRGDNIQFHRLTSQSARRIIKKRADGAGITLFVSGHSLRVGSAVSLAQAGASVVDMQVAGRWKSSQMPAHYAKAELAERGAIARYKDGKR